MGKKTIIFILIIILVVIFGIYAGKNLNNEKSNTVDTSSNKVENKEENNVTENTAENKVENEVQENKTENTNVENNNKVVDLNSEDSTDKAIKIVKDNWGEDSTVYFSFDGKSEKGEYIICVREASTTKALYRYFVNVTTGEFIIEE